MKWVWHVIGIALPAVALLLGIALTASVTIALPPTGIVSTVARVDDWTLERSTFESEARRVGAKDPATRHALLDYLIGEELVVRHAVGIGLPESDDQLHRLIVRQTIDEITRGSAEAEPTRGTLNAFMLRHREFAPMPGVGGHADRAATHEFLLRSYRIQRASESLVRAILAERSALRVWVSPLLTAAPPRVVQARDGQ